MAIRLHELHPSLVHLPLTLIPLAGLCDVAAYATRDRRLARLGSGLWIAASSSALLAGIAGNAASQEVKVRSSQARDTMFLHGIGNLAITVTAAGLTVWRLRNRPSPASIAVGLTGWAGAMYTGYLGGELVYRHGVGVDAADGVESLEVSPPLFSGKAAYKLWFDAARGLGWLFRQFGRFAAGRERLVPGAAGVRTRPTPPPMPEVPPEIFRPQPG